MDYFKIFDVVIAGYGVYFLITWFQSQVLKKTFLPKTMIPADMSMDKCTDPQGFTAFFLPRLLIISLLLIVYGGSSLLGFMEEHYFFVYGPLLILIVVIYVLTVKTARRRFWP